MNLVLKVKLEIFNLHTYSESLLLNDLLTIKIKLIILTDFQKGGSQFVSIYFLCLHLIARLF